MGSDHTDNLSEFEWFSDEVGSSGAVTNEIDTYLGCSPPKNDFGLFEFWQSQATLLPKMSALT